jgi:hypothetical protein
MLQCYDARINAGCLFLHKKVLGDITVLIQRKDRLTTGYFDNLDNESLNK